MNEEIKHLRKILASRRTIKPDKYTGEQIDDHFVKLILEQANWAPTHGYTEPWRFTVMKGEALAELGEFLARFSQPNPDAEDFNQVKFDRLKSRPLAASHVIGIGMLPGTNPKIPEIEEVSAVAMAVQNMWLMAHSMGLGAYWSTGSVGFSDELREFLGFPADHKALGLFYLGRFDGPLPQGRRLSGIEEKTSWRG
jgi:nitroreductase